MCGLPEKTCEQGKASTCSSTLQALQGICAAINSLMIFFLFQVRWGIVTKRSSPVARGLARRSPYPKKPEDQETECRILILSSVFKRAISQTWVFLRSCGIKHTNYVTCSLKLAEPCRNQCIFRDHLFE